MILSILHVLSCMTLAIAAVYWRCTHPDTGSHRFLFPYLMAAGVLGVAIFAVPLAQTAITFFWDDTYFVIHSVSANPHIWAQILTILLPMLPGIGILPVVGKRPLLVGGIALLAILPAFFALFFEFQTNP